jgi:hypothetical protein
MHFQNLLNHVVKARIPSSQVFAIHGAYRVLRSHLITPKGKY